MLCDIDASIEIDVNYNYNLIQRIEILDSTKINYNAFFYNFMLPNVPCIFNNISTQWKCSEFWVTENGKINIDYLEKKYGSDSICVYNCMERYYNSQKSRTTTFFEYIKDLKINNSLPTGEYLKNWHLKLNHEEDNFYEIPIFFASDWLNEFYIKNTDDDYRFVYMGGNDTWTPFHADVFMSYSWSVNVCGRKRWLLFPPGEEENLKDKLGNLPYDLEADSSNLSNILNGKCFEIIQNPGEAIFVPAGWHHQVWNLGDTISVNHNWVNGCNIEKMYNALISNLSDIEKEISDCTDMEDFDQHCQIMLNALFGMDLKMFYEFLSFIAIRRIRMASGQLSRVLFHGHILSLNHILFDLKAIKKVLNNFVHCKEIKCLEYFNRIKPPDILMKDIISTLNE